MKGDLHEIDDLFKAGLEGKEELPEDKVWNVIEQDLDKNSAISIRKKYDRLRRASAILLILLLGVSIYALRDTFTKNQGKSNGQQQSNPPGTTNEKSSGGGTMQKSADADGSNKNPLEASDKLKEGGLSTGEKAGALNEHIIPGNTADNAVRDNSASTEKNAGKTDEKVSNPLKKPGISRHDNLALAGAVTLASPTAGGKSPSSINNSKNNDKVAGKQVKTSSGKNGPPGDANTTSFPGNEIPSSVPAPASAFPGNITSSKWEIALPDINTRHDLPGNTAKLSSANALSDAVKTNPANNLSIPVKNKRSSSLDLPRISLIPMASINLMSNKIKNDLSHPGSQGNEKEDIENTESEKLSFTFSLLADIRIAPRMTLQTGIGYMEKTTAIEPKEVGAVRTSDGKIKYQFDCSAGRYYLTPKYGTWPAVGDSAYTIASANELHYLTIPLAVKYYFGNNKLNFYAIAGGDANILLGQDLTTGLYGASYYGKKTPPKPIGLNNVFVNAMLGAGVNYSLNRRLALTFSPTYRFAVNPINKDMPFKAYPRAVSFAGGLRISL